MKTIDEKYYLKPALQHVDTVSHELDTIANLSKFLIVQKRMGILFILDKNVVKSNYFQVLLMEFDVETENKVMKAFIELEGLRDKYEKFKQSNTQKINGDSKRIPGQERYLVKNHDD